MSYIPPELSGPVPRPLHMRTLSYLPFLLTLSAIAMFSAPFYVYWRNTRENVAPVRGERAEAHVFAMSGPAPLGNGGEGIPFRVCYDFKPPGRSAPLQACDYVTQAKWTSLKEDGPVSIFFDPVDPTATAVDNGRGVVFRPYKPDLFVLPAMASVLLLGVAFPFLSKLNQQRRLLRWGVPAQAQIVSAEPGWSQLGFYVTLVYRFTDARGVELSASVQALYTLVAPRKSSDSDVVAVSRNPAVLYNPRSSSDNILYLPDLLLRVKT